MFYENTGQFKSHFVTIPSNQKRAFNELLASCADTIVDEKNPYLDDTLKAPMNNGPKPAKLSPASFNVYMSQNVSANGDTIHRNGYGLGSGATTVAHDSREVKVHSVFSDAIELGAQCSKESRNQ